MNTIQLYLCFWAIILLTTIIALIVGVRKYKKYGSYQLTQGKLKTSPSQDNINEAVKHLKVVNSFVDKE